MLDHQVGRFSEASMSATTAPAVARAEVEIFGPGGAAVVDCTTASGPDAYRTMYADFAKAIQHNQTPKLDVQHGLRLQRVIEPAETEALLGV